MDNKCLKCGSESAPESKFCEKCGAPLGADAQKKLICPKCRKEFPINARFCDVDGTVLRKSAAVTSFGKYPKASLGNRFVAWLLDGLIILGLCIPAFLFYAFGIALLADDNPSGVLLLIVGGGLFLLPIIYGFIKDGLGKGQSWGKKASGIMVVNLPDDKPCSFGQSFLRNIMPAILSFVPVVGSLIEPVLVLADNDGRRIGDKAANTQVIDVSAYKEPNSEINSEQTL